MPKSENPRGENFLIRVGERLLDQTDAILNADPNVGLTVVELVAKGKLPQELTHQLTPDFRQQIEQVLLEEREEQKEADELFKDLRRPCNELLNVYGSSYREGRVSGFVAPSFNPITQAAEPSIAIQRIDNARGVRHQSTAAIIIKSTERRDDLYVILHPTYGEIRSYDLTMLGEEDQRYTTSHIRRGNKQDYNFWHDKVLRAAARTLLNEKS